MYTTFFRILCDKSKKKKRIWKVVPSKKKKKKKFDQFWGRLKLKFFLSFLIFIHRM